jgi:KDO2-lipid IV(A) lauroyltransferase
MARPHSLATDYLVYLLVRMVVCVIQALPFPAACRLASGLAWLAYRIDRRHRQVAEENLRHAFPDRDSDAERTRMVRAVYQHFCTVLMEIIFIARFIHPTTWRRYYQLANGQTLVSALLSDRPFLMVTGHFGNWEVTGYMVGLFGFTAYAVARRLDNPYLDRLMRRSRERTGQTLLDKNTDFDLMEQVLASGGTLGMLGDQDAGKRGLFVPFFGRPASTHKAMALLALRHNAPMLVTGTYRVGSGLRYEIATEDVILPEDYRNRPDAAAAMTQRLTEALERLIRRHPEQYFWLHRRWKHQPPARKANKVA